MVRNLVLVSITLAIIGLVYLGAIGVNVVSADGNVYESHNPSNAWEIQYGYSIVADNYYHQNGNYDIQDMYAAIRDSFPDHTEKQIFAIMKSYPSKRSSEPSVEEFEDRRGIVIPVSGTFPEYYEEGYES